MKAVSVVVATYRREKELKRALESLAGQSCTDMEIILVDDNGNGEWNAKVSVIADAFKEKHPETAFKCIVNELNQGSAKTRNIGIEASDGEYVTFLDDDDEYLADKVKKQLDFMRSGGYDYSITDLVLYSEKGKEIDRRVRTYIKDTSAKTLTECHLKHHMTGTDTMMFKKDYLVKIGGFAPIDVGDEFYLMQRAIDGSGKFGYLPGCEVKAYVHTGEGGLSSGEGKIKGENALYEYKQKCFGELTPATIRYIKMRHFAVLAFAELRRKKYGAFFGNAIKSFFAAPVACVKMFLRG